MFYEIDFYDPTYLYWIFITPLLSPSYAKLQILETHSSEYFTIDTKKMIQPNDTKGRIHNNYFPS
jgi:hypothetical protein